VIICRVPPSVATGPLPRQTPEVGVECRNWARSDLGGPLENQWSATTGATRSRALPELPTVGDHLTDFEASIWTGIAAPKKTPSDAIDCLNREINSFLSGPNAQARIAELGGEVFTNSSANFTKVISDDSEKWLKVIRAANIKLQ
jgi:tripartite-type tricarboxylate transporter receptor subunit TctC